jgi:antitoxin component of MazEF toxin-antitoxin module
MKSEALLVKVSRLHRSGNGCAIYVPRKALEMTGLKSGDEVLIYVSDGSILLKPLKVQKPSIGSVPP